MDKNFKLVMKNRPRRLRKNLGIRQLCEETSISNSDIIMPVFVKDSSGTQEIDSMPNIYRHSIDSLLRLCEKNLKAGIKAIALFPLIEDSFKSLDAKYAYDENSLPNRATAEVKRHFPEMLVVADIALDPYTTHSHDGILDDNNNILNDETVYVLNKMALTAARAGADIVAPSDMMDGRIGVIRNSLERENFTDTIIMAYSAKFASSLYAPFRDAIGSSKKGKNAYLDKSTYQLNPANISEALYEAKLDEEEGADIIMVKPAGLYLDVISKIRANTNLPVAAYQVSGEYSMIHAAAKMGYVDLEKAKIESLTAIKRAGANMILTYFIF